MLKILISGTKSDWLMKATVKGITNTECHAKYDPLNVSGLSTGIINSQICAVGERSLRNDAPDTCPGKFKNLRKVDKFNEQNFCRGQRIVSFGYIGQKILFSWNYFFWVRLWLNLSISLFKSVKQGFMD
jgi:hypothetical protein